MAPEVYTDTLCRRVHQSKLSKHAIYMQILHIQKVCIFLYRSMRHKPKIYTQRTTHIPTICGFQRKYAIVKLLKTFFLLLHGFLKADVSFGRRYLTINCLQSTRRHNKRSKTEKKTLEKISKVEQRKTSTLTKKRNDASTKIEPRATRRTPFSFVEF